MFDRKEVEKLADLARIELTEEEADELAGELGSILAYVSEIKRVASAGEKPKARAHRNVFREDGNPHEAGVFTDALLAVAPQRDGNYVKVKKIL